MTAERDQLAVTLHAADVGCAADRKLCDPKRGLYTPHSEDADRLIAAGVHLDIDEERLARALHATTMPDPLRGIYAYPGQSWYRDYAAAIAAAYREDAG